MLYDLYLRLEEEWTYFKNCLRMKRVAFLGWQLKRMLKRYTDVAQDILDEREALAFKGEQGMEENGE